MQYDNYLNSYGYWQILQIILNMTFWKLIIQDLALAFLALAQD